MSSKRLFFVLVGEHESNKYSNLIASQLKITLHTEKVIKFKSERSKKLEKTDLYNIWFTYIMMNKGENNIIVVSHDERKPSLIAEVFDDALHSFHSGRKHAIVSIDMRVGKRYSDEFIYKKITSTFFDELWMCYHSMDDSLTCNYSFKIEKNGIKQQK